MRFDSSALSRAFENRIAAHVDCGRFPHASIISGTDAGQSFALAQNIARALVCVSHGEKPCGACSHCVKALKSCHPDIITVQRGKDERDIKVEQVRALVRDAVILPNEAERKVYIIRDADMMNPAAQNAFLKLLEEPPRYAVFILLAENPGLLLETVRSRCAEFDIERPAAENTAEPEEGLAAEYLTRLCGSSELAMAEFCLKIEKLDRQGISKFTDEATGYLASRLRRAALGEIKSEQSGRLTAALKLLREIGEMQEYNVSVGHMAGTLAAQSAEIMLEMRK